MSTTQSQGSVVSDQYANGIIAKENLFMLNVCLDDNLVGLTFSNPEAALKVKRAIEYALDLYNNRDKKPSNNNGSKAQNTDETLANLNQNDKNNNESNQNSAINLSSKNDKNDETNKMHLFDRFLLLGKEELANRDQDLIMKSAQTSISRWGKNAYIKKATIDSGGRLVIPKNACPVLPVVSSKDISYWTLNLEGVSPEARRNLEQCLDVIIKSNMEKPVR